MFTSNLNSVWHYHFSFICPFFPLPTFIKWHMWGKEIFLYALLSESELINRCAVTNLSRIWEVMWLATDHKIHVIHSDYFLYFTHGSYILVTEIWAVLLGTGVIHLITVMGTCGFVNCAGWGLLMTYLFLLARTGSKWLLK